jgi:hypothetical protein
MAGVCGLRGLGSRAGHDGFQEGVRRTPVPSALSGPKDSTRWRVRLDAGVHSADVSAPAGAYAHLRRPCGGQGKAASEGT